MVGFLTCAARRAAAYQICPNSSRKFISAVVKQRQSTQSLNAFVLQALIRKTQYLKLLKCSIRIALAKLVKISKWISRALRNSFPQIFPSWPNSDSTATNIYTQNARPAAKLWWSIIRWRCQPSIQGRTNFTRRFRLCSVCKADDSRPRWERTVKPHIW